MVHRPGEETAGEAPRGGAGIEIARRMGLACGATEAPRGGAGIEMGHCSLHCSSALKPLVEGLVLK